MEKQFVTYEIALKLKELGFNEMCIATFDDEYNFELQDFEQNYDTLPNHSILAPLWQQAIDFLREHYNYNITYNVLEHSFDIAYVFKGGPSKSKFKILSKSSDFYIARERAILTALSRITLNT